MPSTRRTWRCLLAGSLLSSSVLRSPVTAAAADAPLDVKFTDYDCMRIPPESRVLDWQGLFEAVVSWLDRKKGGDVDGQVETRIGDLKLHYVKEVVPLKEAVLTVLDNAVRARAVEQCPLGVMAICVFEAAALASMHTEDVEPKFACIQELLAKLPIIALAGSKWPIFQMLTFLWGLNKLPFRTVGGYQNINRFVQRQYADFTLSPDELAPFGPGVSVPWTSWMVSDGTGRGLDNPRIEELVANSRLYFNSFGPAVNALAAAVYEAVERDNALELGGRPVVRISLVFGSDWAELMPVAWARWGVRGFRASIFVAMDSTAVEICRSFHLVCVPTGVASVLHKYSLTTLALHLGVDVLYCDLDAVPVGSDPLGHIRSVLEETAATTGRPTDLAVSTHNYDCLNAGVWFVRASSSTATFFLLFLEYLYDHWYEGDQRAFNAFATGNVSVSYQAELKARIPELQVAVLDPDVIAGSEGLSEFDLVQVFHAYKVYGEEKMALVRGLYGWEDMPPDVRRSRSELWRLAQDVGHDERVRSRSAALLEAFRKPRTATVCW